jgi:AcrR family transcriptional regulator
MTDRSVTIGRGVRKGQQTVRGRRGGARGDTASAATGKPTKTAGAGGARAGAGAAKSSGARGNGKADPAARRQAILDAALTVFAERGYEAARLDDVAARAGVAKGTLYLYFKDKEALFEALVRGAVSPMLDKVGEFSAAPGMKAADILQFFFAVFRQEVLGTDRKLLLRLIISEGPRFPALAEFYYREVVSRGLQLVRTVARKGVGDGELASDAVARFPQLLIAPLLMAVVWDALFSRFDPLDVEGLLAAHRDLLTGKPARLAS